MLGSQKNMYHNSVYYTNILHAYTYITFTIVDINRLWRSWSRCGKLHDRTNDKTLIWTIEATSIAEVVCIDRWAHIDRANAQRQQNHWKFDMERYHILYSYTFNCIYGLLKQVPSRTVLIGTLIVFLHTSSDCSY